MRKYIFLFLIFLSWTGIEAWSQKITVNAKIDSAVIWVGNQTKLSFEVSQQPKQKVVMPLFSDTIVGGLEIVEPLKADTVISPDGHIQITHSYVVTAFEDSLMYIPPYPFVSENDTFWTKSLSLKVVQPFVIDTAAKSITDIKPVLEPKFNWKALITKILLALFILLLIIALYIFYKKYYKKNEMNAGDKPDLHLPAYVVALEHLEKIKQEKGWQQGRSKEYHTELTDVVREYIERVFNINSMEMTSEEILDHLKLLKKERSAAYKGLTQILKLADLVKFAKWNATPDEHELSLLNAYLFVNQTKVEEVKPIEEIKKEES